LNGTYRPAVNSRRKTGKVIGVVDRSQGDWMTNFCNFFSDS